ncbi:hypothetical protein QVD17_16414 [Tagetes erecta]|uniref:Uncharacterized protein n=1 Tax=Tagetes erecta TaxID=13708 RepID=A0AAD8KV05_TARER|nr:hypothetical protein QVD17_16414 [Tagetes erecta]
MVNQPDTGGDGVRQPSNDDIFQIPTNGVDANNSFEQLARSSMPPIHSNNSWLPDHIKSMPDAYFVFKNVNRSNEVLPGRQF